MNTIPRVLLAWFLLVPTLACAQAQGSPTAKDDKTADTNPYQAHIDELERTQAQLLLQHLPKPATPVKAPTIEPAAVETKTPARAGPTRSGHGLIIDGQTHQKPVAAQPAAHTPETPTIILIQEAPKTAPAAVLPKPVSPAVLPRPWIAPAPMPSIPKPATSPASMPTVRTTTATVVATQPPARAVAPAVRRSSTGNTFFFKTCAQAWLAGRAPLTRGEDGYREALDDDGDGHACETMPVR